ncbi:MAG: hypothetical protein JSV80_08095, partial [Acidobacteriota bacterium]
MRFRSGWLVFLLGATILAGGCAPAPDVAREVPEYDAATFYETTAIGGASFSANESRILMSSDASGIFNV